MNTPEGSLVQRALDAALVLHNRVAVLAEQTADPGLLLELAILRLELERTLTESFGAFATFRAAVAALSEAPPGHPWLFRGAAGFGWAASVFGRYLEKDLSGFSTIDDLVLSTLRDYPEAGDVDLPHGALGLGVFGLAHQVPRVGDEIVEAVLDLLEDRAEEDGAGVCWRLVDKPTRRSLMPESIGYRDIGMAHGQSGVVAFLSSARFSGVDQMRLLDLLEPAVTWLVENTTPDGSTRFPHSVETRHVPSRSAWCYGDPGGALAILQAGAALDRTDLLALGVETLGDVVHRPATLTQVVDHCLCHGSASLVHCLLRGQAMVPDADIESSAAYWVGQIAADIEEVSPGLTYRQLHRPRAPDLSFLEGDTGVALCLLEYASRLRPSWADLLFTSPINREMSFPQAVHDA